ncbi:nucleotide sugar dehydrogenase [Mycobacterium sp. NPDC050551]|uniref:nucleotide sugar dehydrogenase n=1 Tax=Mycobacterium sp. NPDC050551 TaxID=3155407 RepID=UPI003431ECEA
MTSLYERSDGGTEAPVSVFGLGYVGWVSAVCLASRGHRVVGVDVDAAKVATLASGAAAVGEQLLPEMAASVVDSGRLTATTDARSAVAATDISLICVGTRSGTDGEPSTANLETVTDEVGSALAAKDGWHVVVYRSTMVPGTCEKHLVPRLEAASGKRAGIDFGVCVNPDFLRDGTGVRDFMAPPKTVVGSSDTRSGDMIMELYRGLPGPRLRVPVAVAEMAKCVDNSFHALKVGFANEIGAICAAVDLDSHAVMDVFLADTTLNVSAAYLRPGFAFGGSCLPKDVRALTHTARRNDVDTPLLANLLASNETHLRRAVDMVIARGRRNIGVFGLFAKPGAGDLCDNPMVELADRLIGKGFDVKIYEPSARLSRPLDADMAYLKRRMPHIAELLTDDVDAVLAHGEVLIAGSRSGEVVKAVDRAKPDQVIIDLVRLPDADRRRGTAGYAGIGW